MRALNFITSLFILVFIVGFNACQTNNFPGEKEALQVVTRHFEAPSYKGYVEVLEIDELEGRESTYMDTRFYDLQFVMKVEVSKANVISRHFLPDRFQINEEWASSYHIRMERATTMEEKQEVKEFYNSRTFSEGKHRIGVNLTFSELDGRWFFSSLSMTPLREGKPFEKDDLKIGDDL